MCPISWSAIDSTSWRPASPVAATDQAKVEFRRMSDSRISPETVSTVNEVEPSTRSRSGRLVNPITLALSPLSGARPVKPTNCADSPRFGTASHDANACSTLCCNCGAVTPGTSRLVMK